MPPKQKKPRWNKLLRSMQGDEEALWLEVDELIHESNAAAYDKAAALLVNLKALATLEGKLEDFDEWFAELVDDFHRRWALLRTFRGVGLLPSEAGEELPPTKAIVAAKQKKKKTPAKKKAPAKKTQEKTKKAKVGTKVSIVEPSPNGASGEGDEPSLDQWRTLYTAALHFFDAGPWEWLFENDHIAVRHPECDEGYLSIMGSLGEFYSLTTYLGHEGFSLYLQVESMLEGDLQNSDMFMLMEIPALVVSFEPKSMQTPRDLDIAEALGISLEEDGLWPLFRRRRPGLEPWFLTRDEAQQLTWCLEQGMHVAMRMLRHPALRAPWQEHGTVLYREAKADKTEGWVWDDVWEPFTPQPHLYPIQLERRQLDVWEAGEVHESIAVEIDLFPMPAAVRAAIDRPALQPYIWLIADCASQQILAQDLVSLVDETDSWTQHVGQVPAEIFARLYDMFEGLPGAIYVSSRRLASLLSPIATIVGADLQLVDSLPIADYIKLDMFAHFRDKNDHLLQ